RSPGSQCAPWEGESADNSSTPKGLHKGLSATFVQPLRGRSDEGPCPPGCAGATLGCGIQPLRGKEFTFPITTTSTARGNISCEKSAGGAKVKRGAVGKLYQRHRARPTPSAQDSPSDS